MELTNEDERRAIEQLTVLYEQFMPKGGRPPNMLDFGALSSQSAMILLQVVPPAVAEAHSKLVDDLAIRLSEQ